MRNQKQQVYELTYMLSQIDCKIELKQTKCNAMQRNKMKWNRNMPAMIQCMRWYNILKSLLLLLLLDAAVAISIWKPYISTSSFFRLLLVHINFQSNSSGHTTHTRNRFSKCFSLKFFFAPLHIVFFFLSVSIFFSIIIKSYVLCSLRSQVYWEKKRYSNSNGRSSLLLWILSSSIISLCTTFHIVIYFFLYFIPFAVEHSILFSCQELTKGISKETKQNKNSEKSEEE